MSLIIKGPDEFKSDGAKRFTLRMDSQLFKSISLVAKMHRRSVAKEIECAIAEYIEGIIDDEDRNTPVG